MRRHPGIVRDWKSQEVFRHCEHRVRKLAQLDAAQTLEFLPSPPGNRLESLKGKRKGQCSIRVNDQLRICFRWTEEGSEDVEIVDYH